MHKSLTILKALLLGLEVNFNDNVLKLFKPNDDSPFEEDYVLEDYFIAQKAENITTGEVEWLIWHDFSVRELLNYCDSVSNEDFSLLAANVALNSAKSKK